jgi:phosphoglycerate dehydrogenase-like enzyme
VSLTVLRWGQAEYERAWLADAPFPVGTRVLTAPLGDTAPLEEADVVVVPSLQRVTAAHVPRLRRCRPVLTSTSGFDHVDVTAVRAAGIACARLPLARRDAVVESALGMILALTRRIAPMQEAARAGRWEREALPEWGASLLGTVGVIGADGVIGRRMCHVLRALGARVLACDPALGPDAVSLQDLLSHSDVVTLHCALTHETERLIDADALARLRRGAVLVNTARGRLVDVGAAEAAVRAGHLAGLGLDVFPTEPAPLAELAHPRVLLTPHAAGWHPGLGDAVRDGVVEAVRALNEGRPVPFSL